MPVEIQQIMDEAVKLGQLVSQHPSIARYKDARRSVDQDAEASRMLAEFNRQVETLTRQSESGMPPTDAQQQQLETLQSRIISHIKIKALNLAQVEFVDILRKVSQTVQRQVLETGAPAGGAPSSSGPKLTGMGH